MSDEKETIEDVLNALITREYPEDMGAITIYGDGIPALAARLRAAALDEIVAMDHTSTAYWQIVADVLGYTITGDNYDDVYWWNGKGLPKFDYGIWVSTGAIDGYWLLGEWTEGEPKTRIVRPKEGLTR